MNSQIDYKMNTLKRKNWKKLVETLKYKTFNVSTLLSTTAFRFYNVGNYNQI